MENCLFCKIINGEIPSYKIYEDNDIFVILDINPVSIGHALVLPKKHFEMLETTDDEVLAKMIVISKKIGQKIKKILKSDGFNININNGKSAGQIIFHTHFHIVQRFENDNLKLWPADETESRKVQEIYQTIINDIE